MSEADVIQVIHEALLGGLGAITLYVSILSGYLVVIYMAGKELSRFQVLLISFLFVIFSLFMVFGTLAWFGAATSYAITYGGDYGFEPVPLAYGYVISIAEFLGILGSLYFAFDIRRQ